MAFTHIFAVAFPHASCYPGSGVDICHSFGLLCTVEILPMLEDSQLHDFLPSQVKSQKFTFSESLAPRTPRPHQPSVIRPETTDRKEQMPQGIHSGEVVTANP